MTKTDQKRAARAKMRDAQHRQDSASYLDALRELASLEEPVVRADAADVSEWHETVRQRRLEIYADKYEADAKREANAYCDQASALATRRDDALTATDRVMLIDLIVRLDARDTHESLAGRHDAYLHGLALGALGRAEARSINDAMDRAHDEAVAELIQERADAESSHAAVRMHTNAIRMRAMQGRNHRDDERTSIETMHANYRGKPRPN